ncbi:hypothetical protein T440DRAFT_466492 [Plenodomus tracheiphilus IPT5]|uniref:DUF336-domain-containing protein n=1 Tax=Plenodomus tracheiphilus IPT5 TaxID=1408161 RepID=A0A6A7BCC6_9PLEO|nr:hypothetical protein T440DRAFT_466492 [Plenodomus tracheiphilus IPT5]
MATDDISIPTHIAISEAPRDVANIASQEKNATLPYFNSTTAFRLGTALRTRLLTFSSPCVISITTPSTPPHILFHTVTTSGTTLDNDYWVARKRNSVIRWGVSSWQLHNKFEGDEEKFKAKMGLGEKAGEYAIHGGGVPIFVKGVDGLVAVCVVSGLKQWDDHQVVIEELGKLREELERPGAQ